MQAQSNHGHGRKGLAAFGALAVVMLALAIAVRGIPAQPAHLPEDDPDVRPPIAEPAQFLQRGAALRIAELDAHVREDQRPVFRAARDILFHMEGCPPLLEWVDGAEGQRVVRLLGELRAGSREDALGALALIFRLARATEWKPGLMGKASNAERLGALLQDWLRAWAERGARDPLLAEPSVAATALYAHAMRTAWNAPVVGHDDAPYERARAFLLELTGLATKQRTALGEALQAREVRAFDQLSASKDVLGGLASVAQSRFPDIDGECGE